MRVRERESEIERERYRETERERVSEKDCGREKQLGTVKQTKLEKKEKVGEERKKGTYKCTHTDNKRRQSLKISIHDHHNKNIQRMTIFLKMHKI